MLQNIKKPENFYDLLKLQEILDKEVAKERKNGFIPRERTEQDILLSIDDEFQEWLRELPQEYNFKTWKQKEYSREKEFEEFTDVLFFFLQYVRFSVSKYYMSYNTVDEITALFDNFNPLLIRKELKESITCFKFYFWEMLTRSSFEEYIRIAKLRGFTKEDLLNTYWNKWQTNMKRINEDWSLKK